MTTPIALTIAGSDSGGGAGIQADLKAFSALGVYGASVLTALTAQNTREVRAIHDVPSGFIRAQIETVFDDLAVGAVKIGMLSQPEVIETVADCLSEHPDVPVVLDPVMVAKSGDKLLQDEAVDALKTRLLPLAAVVTPNLPEAAVLLGRDMTGEADAMQAAGGALLAMGCRAVLMKGGHAEGDVCTDILVSGDGVNFLTSERVHTKNTHGTGCTLSAAIAAGLARKLPLVDAVTQAHAYLQEAIRQADLLTVGGGHGPVHHFHSFWSK